MARKTIVSRRGNINIIFRLSGTWPFRNYGTLLIVEEAMLLLFPRKFFFRFSLSLSFFSTVNSIVQFFTVTVILCIYAKFKRMKIYTTIPYRSYVKYSKYDIRITTFWRIKIFIRASSCFTVCIHTVYLWNVLLLYKNLLSKSIVQETCDLMGERIGSLVLPI